MIFFSSVARVVACAVGILSLFLLGNLIMGKSKVLKVIFPFGVLNQNPTLLNPSNTESVFEYYLLENLTSGLVRDDLAEPSGYRGVLAEHWEKITDHDWVFRLRTNLRWSDGTPITTNQIVDFFNHVRIKPSRHMIYLRHLASVSAQDHSIHFHFDIPVNDGFLHELSLGDAGLLHPTNLSSGWKVTSGPYTVESYDWTKKNLLLRINSNCVLFSTESPEQVELFSVGEINNFKSVFNGIDTDLIFSGGLAFTWMYQSVKKHAPQSQVGSASSIYYFSFNAKNPLVSDHNTRIYFSSIVRTALQDQTDFLGLHPEFQFIPMGFDGRLQDYIWPQSKTPNPLFKKEIEILVSSTLSELLPVLEKIKVVAEHDGVKISFTEKKSQTGDSHLAHVDIFKGNQKDSLGSWGFLFGHEGALHPFRRFIEDDFISAIKADRLTKQEILLKIHRKVLDEAWGVPFLVGASAAFASNRVVLSRWNSFDMRMRFYDVRWR